MNRAEYTAYEKSVADFFEREGINCLSQQPINPDKGPDEDWEYDPDLHFSWSPCHCCGSQLGGDRQTMCGYNPTTKEIQSDYSVCVDCVYYVEYGRLYDTTMLEIEVSTK